MPRAAFTVAEVFRRYGDTFRAQAGAALSTAQRRVMTAIEQCRTAALGGHVEQCDRCGHRRVWYNSCRNRHCPTCQSLARAAWLERRRADLPPTEYFHVVFTVPPAVAEVATQKQGRRLRAPLPRRRRDAPHDRRRPSPSRRRDRLLRRPPHLGRDARPSPASALRDSGVGGSQPMAAGGLPAAPGSSCRSGVLSRYFRRVLLHALQDGRLRVRASCVSPVGCTPSTTPGASPSTSDRPARPNGWSTRSDPSPVPSRSSTTSAVTPTGSPSATSACAASTTAACASATRTIAGPARPARRPWR